MAAMSHVQLVLPLLVLLFFVPALRGYVPFHDCKQGGPKNAHIFKVDIVPHGEQITIKIWGGARHLTIDGKKIFVYVTLKSPNEDDLVLKSSHLCDVSPSCDSEGQIKWQRAFRLTLADINYAPRSKKDMISVSLQYDDTDPPNVLRCVEFKPVISAQTLASA